MRTVQFILLLLTLSLLSACANTRQARDVHPSGFLGTDAVKLQKGGKGMPALYYLKPGVDWSKYDKMLLDPVTFWDAPDGKDRGVSKEDAQQVVNYFHGLIYTTFSKEMKMVTTPQPGTIRVKVAITKAEKSHVVLDLVSTIEPQARVLSGLKDLVTGKPAFVGEAAIAVKINDATTGDLLAEAVDERVGGKTLSAEHFKSWGEVDQALQYWVSHAARRLCDLQKRPSCPEVKKDTGLL
ncbi:MAG: DUF3313 domain-containing protein [Pseudomonadota bacterium]|nr:DUF3313 domain-containing protein [Pseudomonadota bacterium]